MRKLSRYLKYYKKEVIVGPVFKLLEAIFELIVPLVMASIIDDGIRRQNEAYVWKMGGLMILLGFLGLIFALICQYSAAKASQGVGTKLRDDLFAHCNKLSHAELDAIGTNSLITRITNDVNQIQVAVAMLIRLAVRAPFLVIGATVMAMMLDLKLSVIFWIVAPLVAVVLYFVMWRSVPYYKVRQKKLDRVSLVTRENLSGARVVRAFSGQKQMEEQFDEANGEVTEIAVRVGKISALLNPLTFLILNLAIVAILWFGGKQVDGGLLSQGEVIAFVNYMTQISLALVVVANLVVIFTKAGASAARINEIFELEPGIIEEPEEGSQASGISASYNKQALSEWKVEFDHVSFAYHSGENYALENVDFKVKAGETIGIIGGTGDGKSTLINLMPRFYEVEKGEIRIDGIPVKQYKLNELRRKFGIVPQNAVLFSGTIEDNLRWAREDATKAEIEEAAEAAQAKEVIDGKEGGYGARIEAGGKNLSGGQRQRLTIARALVGKPEILILDDSSSALDYATDARLRRALRNFGGGMTVFIVSQRANSIKHADHIIVLDDGRVAGIGTHSELFHQCEEYREICLSQLSEQEAAAL